MLADLDESWLARRYYGGDLPAEAERSLHLAAASWHDEAAAESHLARAAELAPGHRLVDLGHYKYHFYKAHLPQALTYARRMVDHALTALDRPGADWRSIGAADADFAALEPVPRFFLFALAAKGYLLLRLGRIEEGCEALVKVRDLDPEDRMGAARLLAVAERQGRDDDE